ncbi:Protein CBG12414 [Caenorhabditis briggsae]|uniref:Protein CBG12414 n=1 Tax=Caenorhabditis briggsae TaxID=6238 RepID=A8XFD6_CAEBR|nr:Protein CBG12414 [Caenorhabditis briggsae]CAP31397.2 Protein CBG12414 [Caenorhabditis briggsae]
MAESIIDFVLVAIILAALAVATLILLFMYSTRIRQPFQKCLGRRTDKTEDVETGIAPKRTTIRVVKSLPNSSLPPTPSAYTKPPIRRYFNVLNLPGSRQKQFQSSYKSSRGI